MDLSTLKQSRRLKFASSFDAIAAEPEAAADDDGEPGRQLSWIELDARLADGKLVADWLAKEDGRQQQQQQQQWKQVRDAGFAAG